MGEPVLVLGGGLAGVACARELGDAAVEVTLVDRNDYHQFQPLLYQVASSQLPAEDIARPHRTIFREYPSVEVVNALVTAADMSARSLTLAGGRTLQGSHLVMAAGARPNFFGVPGAAEYAFPLYSVADAERLRLHLQGLLEAAVDDPPSREPGSIDIVVVGGGPTGVETTGALAELMLALHKSGGLTVPGQITLVDLGDALLGQFSDKAHEYALKKLTEAGAEVRLGLGVTSIHPDRVQFNDGSAISTRTVVWGGGSRGLRWRRAPDPPPVAVVASTSARTSRWPATQVPTPWEMSRTFRQVTTGQRCPNWARWPSSRGSGRGRTFSVSCTESPPNPLSTRTRASWR